MLLLIIRTVTDGTLLVYSVEYVLPTAVYNILLDSILANSVKENSCKH